MSDFHLFTNGDAALSDADADVGFTMAYLADELTPVQNLAFEKRFASDAEFREVAQPIMDAWFVPRSLHNPATRVHSRTRSMARIAAVIAIITVPVLTLSQAVAYAAAHPSTPGHAIARQIVQSFTTERETTPVVSVDIATRDAPQSVASRKVVDSIPQTRKIGAVVAQSTDTFPLTGGIPVRVLSDGRVFVTDRVRKVVSLYDPTLTHVTEIPLPENRWAGPVTVTDFRGDSTLLISNAGSVYVDVLDPTGRVARTIAWGDRLLTMPLSTHGAIVANSGFVVGMMPRGVHVSASGFWSYKAFMPKGPANEIDTSIVFRSALGSMRIDTVAFAARVVEPAGAIRQWKDSLGVLLRVSTFPPMQESDAVVTHEDGTIAVIRAKDYHIDWIEPNGSKRATPPVAHVWRRLGERERAAIVEDAQATVTQFMTAGQYTENGARVFRTITQLAQSAAGFERQPAFITMLYPLRYKPLADAEGRLWIPQSPTPGSGATPAIVFDIVNRSGKLVDRVEMPPTMIPVAFAPGLVFAMQWMGTAAGCPHPAPGTGAPASELCMRNLGRLVSFHIK